MWEELVKITLLGTERTEISDKLESFLKQCNLPPARSSENELLQLLSVYAPAKKTKIQAQQVAIEIPQAKEETQTCSAEAAKKLQLILKGTYAAALPEFFYLLSKKEQTLPPSALPDLFEKSLADTVLWQQIQSFMPPFGEWLLHQNINWTPIWLTEKDINWEQASPTQRVRYITQLRKSDTPESAIEIVENIWDDLEWKRRLELLKPFKDGLSKADESFLTKVLKEKRKDLRQPALNFLLQISDSELSIQLFDYLKEHIAYQSGKLKIDLPATDKNPFADAINFSKKDKLKEGIRTTALAQLFAKTDLKKWADHFELDEPSVIQLFLRSDHKAAFAERLIEAAQSQKNETWATALLSYWLKEKSNLNWIEFKILDLIPLLSDDSFNHLAITCPALASGANLPKEERLLYEQEPLFLFLKNSNQFWKDDLSRTILPPLKKHISELSQFDWSTWHYKDLLQNATYRINPKLNLDFEKGWESFDSGWEMWQTEIEQFLGGLRFRKQLYEAFGMMKK